jgi:hypothetical protein
VVAEWLIFLEGMNYAVTILIIVALTALVGEVISNTATRVYIDSKTVLDPGFKYHFKKHPP